MNLPHSRCVNNLLVLSRRKLSCGRCAYADAFHGAYLCSRETLRLFPCLKENPPSGSIESLCGLGRSITSEMESRSLQRRRRREFASELPDCLYEAFLLQPDCFCSRLTLYVLDSLFLTFTAVFVPDRPCLVECRVPRINKNDTSPQEHPSTDV